MCSRGSFVGPDGPLDLVGRRNSGHAEAVDSKANPHVALLDMRPDRANVTVTVILLGGDGQ